MSLPPEKGNTERLQLTRSDRKFLKDAGVAVEQETWGEQRLALARRIAKHRSPGRVQVSPDAARLGFVRRVLAFLSDPSKTPDATLEFLMANDVPLTPENYRAIAYLGNPPQETDAETDIRGGE